MELIGEEKRIPALFSEARLADEQTAPSFARVWNRAQAKTYRPRKAFNLAFVAATVLLVCALGSLAWWSMRWQGNSELVATIRSAAVAAPVTIAAHPPKAPVPSADFRPATVHAKPSIMRLKPRAEDSLLAADQKATREAKAIAAWQSPTSTLLDSSSNSLLKSLPQMNQTVDEMKSFLPSQPE